MSAKRRQTRATAAKRYTKVPKAGDPHRHRHGKTVHSHPHAGPHHHKHK
ncbi:MAG TPA: hypothetical protein VLT86_09280 [Vicinamibacterales bacterium]|nr:hypothetical protein [Vicinamibacterales bacterium]